MQTILCKVHGTNLAYKSHGYFQCKKCRSECVARYRKRIKEKLVEIHGGKCRICGYNKCIRSLDFHHIDPTTKKFGISQMSATKSFKLLQEEAKKCVLVCKNCHTEIEDGLTILSDFEPQNFE